MHSTPTSRAKPIQVLALGLLLALVPSMAFAADAVISSLNGQTDTLLPDGSVLQVGGSVGTGANAYTGGLTGCPSAGGTGCSVSINRHGVLSIAPDLPTVGEGHGIARSSHTATLLPNGEVLVAGGVAADGFVRSSLVIYDERTGWLDTGLSMAVGRYNHTATLLKTGGVLICGGATVVNPGNVVGNVTATCDVYTPYGILGCANATGCVAAAANMLAPRSLHTASMLADGRVFFTGGWDGAAADFNTGIPGAINTSEVYTAATPPAATPGVFGGAHALIKARYNHTATVMGDGRVLILGGFDGGGRDYGFTAAGRNTANNFGILDSVEIYDPRADSIVPGAQMPERNQSFGVTLNPDGSVEANGGLGNVTTTFMAASPCAAFDAGSKLVGTDAGALGTGRALTISPGDVNNVLSCMENFRISPALPEVSPTGEVETGFILYSSPTVTLPSAKVYFNEGGMDQGTWLPYVLNANSKQLFSDLAGTDIYLDNTGLAGTVLRDFTFDHNNVTGRIVFYPLAVTIEPQNATSASITMGNSPISTYNGPPGNIGNTSAGVSGDFHITLQIQNLPAAYYNSVIQGGSINIAAASIEIDDTGTGNEMGIITLVEPDANTPAAVIASIAGATIDGAGTLTLANADVTSLQGTVQASTPSLKGITNTLGVAGTACGEQQAGGGPCKLKVASMNGTMAFSASPVSLAGAALNQEVGFTTVTIKSMNVGDKLTYTPTTDSWAVENLHTQSDVIWGFGGKAMLLPDGTQDMFGGRSCDAASLNVSCNSRSVTSGHRFLQKFPSWESGSKMLDKRANHSATVMPNGLILLAGGTNGPNVLNTAETFKLDDPSAPPPADLPTGNMIMTRSLHTATLLPNGRVLLAGGFTTTNSTGSTNTAEVYYPGGAGGNGYFVATPNMANARDDHAAVLGPDGNPIVIGGYDSNTGQYLSSVEVYFSTGNTWSRLPDMNKQRALMAAALLRDGRIVVIGGVNAAGPIKSAEVYDPTTNAWTETDNAHSMPTGLFSMRASMLPDGRLLVTGGDDAFGETQTSLIYDPAGGPAGAFTQTTSTLIQARLNHDQVLLPNGTVVAFGGAQGVNTLATVETFDTYTQGWSKGASINSPRSFHATAVAGNGEIVTFGGSVNGTPTDTIEFIDFDDLVDLFTPGGQETGLRQSTIAVVDVSAFDHVSTITYSGQFYRGRTEASGGGAENSDFNEPRLVITALDAGGGSASQGTSGFFLDLSTRIYSTTVSGSNPPQLYNTTNNGIDRSGNWSIVDSSITIAMPSDTLPAAGGGLPTPGNFLPYGWYQLISANNAQYSKAAFVHSGPFLPSHDAGAISPIPNPAASFYASENLPQTPSLWVTSSTVHWKWTCAVPAPPAPTAYCPQDAGINGFNVYLATTGVFTSTIAYSTNVFVQSGLAPNTTVSIIVAPYNLSGDVPLTSLSYSATFFTLSTAPVTGAFSISSVAFAGVQLSWLTNNNQQGTIYEVSESTDDPIANGHQPFTTSISTPVPTFLGNTTNFAIISGLSSNTTFYFRVRSMNSAGLFSNFSAIVSTETRSSVATPTGQALTTYSIQWTWQDAFLAPNAHYNIYNATSGVLIGQVAEPPPGNAPVFVETQLSTNTPNAIAITAVTSAGEGPLSGSATVYTLAAVPGSAANIANVSTGSLTAFWSANQNPINTRYDCTVTTAKPVDSGISVVTTTKTVTNNAFTATFIDLGPAGYHPAQPVVVQVYSVNGDGVFSTPLNLTPLNNGTTSLLAARPDAPVITGVTGTSISLSWTSANNTSSATYEVTYTTDGFVNNISTALPYSALSNQLAITVNNLVTGTTYQFRVRSFDLYGTWNGLYSPLSVTTATANGGAPSGSLAAVVDPNQNVTIAGTLAGQRPFSLFIPANTFAQTVTITVSTTAFNPPAACSGGGPYGLNFTVNPPIEPLHPAFLTLTYTPPDVAGMNLSQLALERIDSATGRCVPLATTVNQAASQVTATLNHFSLFQLGVVQPSGSVESTLIFPNPFMPTEGNGYVTFSEVPAQAHIQIYTLKGALVNEGYANVSGIWLWAGTNRAGRPVASGIYLAVVRSGDTKKIFKVVVLR